MPIVGIPTVGVDFAARKVTGDYSTAYDHEANSSVDSSLKRLISDAKSSQRRPFSWPELLAIVVEVL